MKSIVLYLVGALLIFVSSCREPKDLVFKEYKNLRAENIGFSDADLKVDLVYYNPNGIGLELNKVDLDLYVDGNYLGKSTQNVQVSIPARKDFTLPLSIKVDMKNLLKNGLNTLFNKAVNIRLLGSVKVGKAGIYKNVKVDYTTVQNF